MLEKILLVPGSLTGIDKAKTPGKSEEHGLKKIIPEMAPRLNSSSTVSYNASGEVLITQAADLNISTKG